MIQAARAVTQAGVYISGLVSMSALPAKADIQRTSITHWERRDGESVEFDGNTA